MRTNNGAIQISRSIQDSEIWLKPPDWLKIWLHILMNVNFGDTNLYKRGENFFNYEILSLQCGVKYKTVVNCIKFLKDRKQIEVRKTTRGVNLKVINYDEYQTISNYEGKQTENRQNNKRKTEGNTIKEEGKEGKNEKNINNKLAKIKIFEESSFEYKLTKYFINKQLEIQNPNFIYLYNKNGEEKLIQKWSDEIRKLKELDKYTEKQIDFIIKYLFENDFWKDQIISLEKLRKKQKSTGIPYFVVLINEAKKQTKIKTSIGAGIKSEF